MKNRHQKPPTLPRPSRCRYCGGAVKWETETTEGRRVDLYRCIMCGRDADQVAVERRRG
jgi:hypothetical protein